MISLSFQGDGVSSCIMLCCVVMCNVLCNDCGEVWYDVAYCGVVGINGRGVVWCGVVWFGLAWRGVV